MRRLAIFIGVSPEQFLNMVAGIRTSGPIR
jgi:hypothetical protein